MKDDTASPAAARDDLEIVKASPDVLRRHDKGAWLELFTSDARLEDPVGAGAHIGTSALSKFWDVFIAPNDVRFIPICELVCGNRIVRHVTISTITPVDREPFELRAVVEYALREGRVASLRAFWEPQQAVWWHAKKGLRGMVGLTRHGIRMTKRLGLGASLGFGRSLVPSISRSAGRAWAERFAATLGRSRRDWLDLVRGAALEVAELPPARTCLDDAERAWTQVLAETPLPHVEEVIVAGDHFATVLSTEDATRSAALIGRVRAERLVDLRLAWSFVP